MSNHANITLSDVMTESKRGGSRTNAGLAKDLQGEKTRKITLSLDECSVEFLNKFGDGNVSRGIRECVRELKKTNKNTQ